MNSATASRAGRPSLRRSIPDRNLPGATHPSRHLGTHGRRGTARGSTIEPVLALNLEAPSRRCQDHHEGSRQSAHVAEDIDAAHGPTQER